MCVLDMDMGMHMDIACSWACLGAILYSSTLLITLGYTVHFLCISQ